LTGSAGANLIYGSADTIDGGDGIDSVDYSTSAAAVTVNLAVGAGLGGDAEGDVISGVERIIGSRFGDVLTGDDARNWLSGGAGDDTMLGGGGADVFLFGAGHDSIDGGDGDDTAFFTGNRADFDVVVLGPDNWFVTEIATGAGDTLTSIETLRFADGDFIAP
jgi:Ca2+-binding RTX toxin-like protein